MTHAELFKQTRVWIDASGRALKLKKMDPDHRANLIPFLRGNARTFHHLATGQKCPSCAGTGQMVYEWDADGVLDVDTCNRCGGTRSALGPQEAQEWLEQTPLMQRLVKLEAGRPIDERRATHERNQAFEQATGYRKVRLG